MFYDMRMEVLPEYVEGLVPSTIQNMCFMFVRDSGTKAERSLTAGEF